jgi:WD repeat-containing protein 61
LDSNIKIWDIEVGGLLRGIDTGSSMYLLFLLSHILKVETWGISFSPDGKFLASTGQTGNINIWSVETGQKQQVFSPNGKFTMSVAYVSFFFHFLFTHSWKSPNGQYIACGAIDGVVTIFDVNEGKRLHSIEG